MVACLVWHGPERTGAAQGTENSGEGGPPLSLGGLLLGGTVGTVGKALDLECKYSSLGKGNASLLRAFLLDQIHSPQVPISPEIMDTIH